MHGLLFTVGIEEGAIIMEPGDIIEIDEVEAFCPNPICDEITKFFINGIISNCSQCGRPRETKDVIREAEETGKLNLQEFYQRI